jgi:hypothetical protein
MLRAQAPRVKLRLGPPEPRHSTSPPRGHPINPPASQQFVTQSLPLLPGVNSA